MQKHYHLPKCYLNIGQHKTLYVDVHLDIATMYDEDGELEDVNPKDFLDGVRAQGELFFECFPLVGNDKHPVKKNAIGQLTLMTGDVSTRVNVLIVEKTNELTVIRDHVRRYCWLFFVIGKPVSDELELFPKPVEKVNHLFVCTDFRGLWPVEVSSLVIAKDQITAKKVLVAKLIECGINQPEVNDLTLQEIDLNRTHAVVLNKGEY